MTLILISFLVPFCLFSVLLLFVKDVQGDTALHDAIGRRDDIINMLIACDDVDFKLMNQKGFNVLHETARDDDTKFTKRRPHREHVDCVR